MKLIETKAIVLSSIKYGETSLILKCYTENEGIKSFIVKGAFSKKRKNNFLFFPLNELNITYSSKANKQLIFLKTAQVEHYYDSLHTHPIKSTIVFFLTEILGLVLKEEIPNAELYHYIEDSLKKFDQKKEYFSDFHLIFLIQLSYFLGFYPNLESNGCFFDLENGFFYRFKLIYFHVKR